MGLLIRLLLKVLGRPWTSNPYLSEVSKTIELLSCRDGTKWFWGGLLHFFLVGIGLGLLFSLRHTSITHSWREIIALVVAAMWTWLGPVLIWYYERHTLPAFEAQCKHIVAHQHDLRALNLAVYSNINTLTFTRVFAPTWVVIV